MKNVFSLVLVLLLGVTSLCAQMTDRGYKDALVGSWEMTTVEIEGEVMTAADLGMNVETIFREDGTVIADDPQKGGKRESKWDVVNGVITSPDEPEGTKMVIISLSENELLVDLNTMGMILKVTMKKNNPSTE